MQQFDQAAAREWLQGLFTWREKRSGMIAPDERLPWGDTTAMGVQHVLAMFGSTVLAPIYMGFDTNVAIFFSAIGTLLFFFITGGRIPSYLGSSFAFIAPVVLITDGIAGSAEIPKALGGIVICGVVYTVIGLIVHFVGSDWIDALMPPIVTGAVVAIIGLNLAGAAQDMAQDNMTLAIITILATVGVALVGRGLIGRLPILLGTMIGYLVALVAGGTSVAGRDIGFWHITGVDLGQVGDAAWLGMPNFQAPSFDGHAIGLIAPVAVILVAENTGHIKAVSEMTNRNLMPWLGRGFIGDGIATTLSGFGGGTGVTTYAENIGVMAVTRVFSTAIFLIAAGVAFLLSFSPKFGAVVSSIPLGVLGGAATVLFGLIAAAGIRIWIDNRVDFSKGVNLFIAAVTLIVGTADYTIKIGDFGLNGIALGTFGSIILYQIFRLVPGALEEDPGATPASAGLDEEYGGAAAGTGVRWDQEERFAADRRQREARPGREARGQRSERRPAPRREMVADVEEIDMDDPEMMRPRRDSGRRVQSDRRQAPPEADEFGFGEPQVARQPRSSQPGQQRRRSRPEPQQRRPAPVFGDEIEGVVIDEPATTPRNPQSDQAPRHPGSASVRDDREEFGFDEPMPVPEQPRPPRVQQRRPQQRPRRPEPENDEEPLPPTSRRR